MKLQHKTIVSVPNGLNRAQGNGEFRVRNRVRKTKSFIRLIARAGRPVLKPSSVKELNLQELAMISLAPLKRAFHQWWLGCTEKHYLMCAEVEQQRVKEAQSNVAYYQRKAALARSARL